MNSVFSYWKANCSLAPVMTCAPFLLTVTTLYSAGQASAPPKPGVPATQAQTTYIGPTRTFTLGEVLNLAEQHSPQVRAAQARIAGARAGIVTAKAYPNPSFDSLAGHQYQRLPEAVPGTIQHYGFSQSVDLPSLRSARATVAKLRQTTTEFELADARLQVQSAVKQAFYDVLRRQQQVEIANENLRLVEDLNRRIRVQVDVGESGRLELTRAEAELATARSAVKSAQLQHVTALSALRLAVGTSLNENLSLAGNLDARIDLPPLENLQRITLDRHPLLKAAETNVLQARAELKSQRAQRIPVPSLQGYYEHQPDLGFFELGVSIPIPIWNRRQGPIAEAQAAADEATAARDLERLQLNTSLENAFGEYQLADQQVQSFQSGALRAAQAAVTASEAAYKAGARGIIEVLDAQRVLRSVRLDYLDAQYDRQSALIELERLRAVDSKGNTP